MKPALYIRLLCTWFGSGYMPKASGTAGSLAALPFAFVIQRYLGAPYLFAAAVIIFFIGWWASNIYLGDDQNRDPKEIVIDEVAGMWLVLSALPFTWAYYATGFVLFRAFDAFKPWPICVADQKIKGGFGVMFDDILAAIAAILVIGIWRLILPQSW